jgi:uncharacterized protein
MFDGQLFLDTAYAQALLNHRDQHHPAAIRLQPVVAKAAIIWTTHFVLAEIGNALGATRRVEAVQFIDRF